MHRKRQRPSGKLVFSYVAKDSFNVYEDLHKIQSAKYV